jgi:GNAT superfamily N-acetyltransferase
MNNIDITPVLSRHDRMAFLKLPWRIYAGNPAWVPPLLMDRRKLIDRKRNPFYLHADAEFFLARRNGEVLGRIAAINNHLHVKEHGEKTGFFGFFECIDDQSVADALFTVARNWLKARGLSAIRGPASPSVNDEYGLLVDGFDRPPVFLMPYNPHYYMGLIENAGLRKVKDLYAFHVNRDRVLTDRLLRFHEAVTKRSGLTFRTVNMKDFRNEVDRLKILFNRAWQKNWGAIPMTDEEFEYLAKDFRSIVVPELVIFAEFQGEAVGFSLSLPDLNMALKHNRRGYLLPGLYSLLRYKKDITWTRVMILGVLPEFQKTGAGGLLFYETARRSSLLGYNDGEAGWVLEDNHMMLRGAELMNAVRTKTYRIYESSL